MSLINDALKKAKQSQKSPPPLPMAGSPLKPVEFVPAKQSELPVLIVIGVLVLVGITALVVTFLVFKRGQVSLAAAPAPEQPVVAKASPAPPPSSSIPAKSPVATSASATPATVASTPAPVVATQPQPAGLPKLQGIFYSPSRPSALIDGKTVLVGDHVGGFQVMAIAQGQVVLGNGGQNYTLTLPQWP